MWIEVRAAESTQLRDRLLERPGALIRTLVGERIEHIGERNDPSAERYVLPAETGWIARPVPALMMG